MAETTKSRTIGFTACDSLAVRRAAIADDLDISVAAVEEVVDRTMLKVDNDYRLRAVRLDLERLEAMQARFVRDALGGDLAAGHLCLKIAELTSRKCKSGGPGVAVGPAHDRYTQLSAAPFKDLSR
jgi:hypothetical protein